MFGHKDDQSQDNHIGDNEQHDQSVSPDTGNHAEDQDDSSWQHPGTPLEHNEPVAQISDVVTTSSGGVAIPSQPDAPDTPTSDDSDSSDDHGSEPGSSDLLDIKRKALSQLSPLVGHLDQSPEEKFRTLMMLIQGSDDQSLLSQAYETAEAIQDEKVRAQALLDVVNEINYFTHQKDSQ